MHRVLAALLRRNATHARGLESRFDDIQDAQSPEAVTVCCSDSRVLQDHMWGNDVPGRLFTCSNIGNRVVQRTDHGEVVSGDVLYPIVHADTGLVIVTGHTGCGAVTAAYDDLTGGGSEPAGISHCLELLRSRLEAGVERLPPEADRTETINRLLKTSDDVPPEITVVGAVYDFQDVYSGRRGEIHIVNIDGETSVERLRSDHPEIASRIDRLWEY